MNIVAKTDLTFQNFTFNPIVEDGQVWLTSTELAKVLEYKKTDAISQIYARNSDEFTGSMTTTLKLSVIGINNSLRKKSVRVYSLRGAHLIAMFSNTPVAKEFRKWVLDILDKEVQKGEVHSPLHRYFVKVIINDTLFGGQVEFMGKGNTFNAVATGICKNLGLEPTSFTPIEMGIHQKLGVTH
ncbi:BRO-N domain-containing protein [Providencia rettgeri]|uniref:BRO-N domain-containing protein n=1 Tax=Providencia rettgeri TaxID=587 RepID=UPI0032F008C4